MDAILVYGGMTFTVVLLLLMWMWLRRGGKQVHVTEGEGIIHPVEGI